MTIDRVTLEILRNHYQAVVEDMARIMERTAYTTFVKETADFSTGLVSTGGEYVAYPWSLGASSYLGLNMAHTLRSFERYDEGDIVICNDAYLSGPLCTHLPDVHILRPIFHEGRIICWGYAFVHSSDMGGAVPASVWPRATEIFQEGLRLRPTKLYRAGVLQEDVKNLICDNCRIPEMNWGDIKAMVAAVSSCDRRMQAMVRKFGLGTVVEGIDAVLDYAEQRARAAIRKIPDGVYRFTEYMEDDLRSEVPVRLQVALTVEGDSLHLDFTGTDPQVGAALNIASHGVTHPFLCQAINAYLVTEDPGIPKASSILRPVRVTAPPGCLVNALFPSPIGVRYGTVLRVFDAVLGALAQALPGRIPAAPAGAISPVVASILDPLTGRRQVQVVEPMLGGGGGRPTMDGLGGADSTSGFLRNTPVESIEAEVPIVMRRYHLIPDTGGAGEHRGGLAIRLDFQVYHPHAIVTARGMERFRLEPWGVAGGRAGTIGSCIVNRGTTQARDIGKVDVLHLEPGDVVSIFSPSGGGHGDPRRRDPTRVRDDVRAGYLSVDRAREAYGVVLVDGEADPAATARLRAAMSPSPDGSFDFGGGRAELERRWPPAIQDAAARLLESIPPTVRDWGKHQLYDRIQTIAAERTPTPADVETAWTEIRARLGRALGET
ncbi:MAG TPA: hydantoinase B/oxoprolinase family protein [Methylomirabilota bacterium]|nr:hydantoinase B/oxoprolinase family protein [Methylomirabilota bacterium]